MIGDVINDPGQSSETAQERLARFTRDYWAPDRDAVLAQMKQDAGMPGPAPTPGSNGNGGVDPPPPAPGGGTIADPGVISQAWFAWGDHSPAGLAAFKAAHPEYAMTIAGSHGDKVTINGRTYDMIIGAGAGGSTPSFNDITDQAGGAGGGGAPGVAIDPSYLAPFDQQFAPPGGFPENFSYPGFVPPDGFKPPTADDILKDPSYLFRLSQGEGALENSAAARGMLNTGQTLGDILKFGQNFASQEYGNIWNRDFNVWNTDYQHAFDVYGTNRNNASDIYTKNYGAASDADSRAFRNFQDQKSTFYANQNNPFQKLYSLSSLGSASA